MWVHNLCTLGIKIDKKANGNPTAWHIGGLTLRVGQMNLTTEDDCISTGNSIKNIFFFLLDSFNDFPPIFFLK